MRHIVVLIGHSRLSERKYAIYSVEFSRLQLSIQGSRFRRVSGSHRLSFTARGCNALATERASPLCSRVSQDFTEARRIKGDGDPFTIAPHPIFLYRLTATQRALGKSLKRKAYSAKNEHDITITYFRASEILVCKSNPPTLISAYRTDGWWCVFNVPSFT